MDETKHRLLRQKLEKPFENIKTREASWGKEAKYAEIKDYIEKLNDATDLNWPFEIIEHFVMAGEVIVHGRLTIDGISKDQFGSAKIKMKSGTTEIMQAGADYKIAAADCIKKCASLFGVGLSMYEESDEEKQESRREECAFNLNLISEGEKELAQISDCTVDVVKKHLCTIDLTIASNDALGGYVATLKARIVKKKKEIEKEKNEAAATT